MKAHCVQLVFLLAGCSFRSRELDKSTMKLNFNIPRGEACETLKIVSKQAEVEFIFSIEEVSGVFTNAIRGEYSLMEAFDIMLKDTALDIIESEESRAYSVKRRNPSQGSFHPTSFRPFMVIENNCDNVEIPHDFT